MEMKSLTLALNLSWYLVQTQKFLPLHWTCTEGVSSTNSSHLNPEPAKSFRILIKKTLPLSALMHIVLGSRLAEVESGLNVQHKTI